MQFSGRCYEFSYRRLIKVPLLNPRHRRLRFQWPREHRHRIFKLWKRFVLSHKFRFLLHCVEGRVRIRPLTENQLLDENPAGAF